MCNNLFHIYIKLTHVGTSHTYKSDVINISLAQSIINMRVSISLTSENSIIVQETYIKSYLHIRLKFESCIHQNINPLAL